MHVYTPGVEGGYIPIEWKMADTKGWLAHPVSYPASHLMRFPEINETAPVYDGHVRLSRDVTIGQPPEIAPLLGADRTLTIEGEFRYQACDDNACYPPKKLPIEFNVNITKAGSSRTRAHGNKQSPHIH